MKQVADPHLRKQSFKPHLFQGYILGKAVANEYMRIYKMGIYKVQKTIRLEPDS